MDKNENQAQPLLAFLKNLRKTSTIDEATSIFRLFLKKRFNFDLLAFQIDAHWFFLDQTSQGGWISYEELMLLRSKNYFSHASEFEEERRIIICSPDNLDKTQQDDLNILIESFVNFLPYEFLPSSSQDDDGEISDDDEAQLLEEELRELRLQLVENQQVAKIGNWSFKLKSKVFQCSLSMARVLAISETDLPNSITDFIELFDERSQKKLQKANALVTKKGGMYEEELVHTRTDGVKRTFLATGKGIIGKKGKIQSISGAVRDISELKNFEENLRTSERRLSAATKGANIGIWEKNLNSPQLYLNPISKEILGITSPENEVDVNFFIERAHPDDQKLIRRYLSNDNVLESFKFFFRFQKNLTELIYVEASGTLFYSKSVDKAKYIGVITDITYRKLNEIKLKEINLQLEGILNNSSSAIFIKRKTGQLVLMNHTGRKWWNLQEIKNLVDSHFFDGTALAITRDMDARIIKERTALTYEISTPISGVEKVLLLTKFPIIYSDDEIFIGGIATDITQLKVSEQELRKAVAKAEESDRLKSAFLANMSHEIRTPLNSIIGFSDILKRTGIAEQDQVRFLKIINAQGKHLLGILNDIIDLSAIESNQLKLNYSEVNITELLEIQQQSFQEKITVVDKKGVEIVLSVPIEDAFFVHLDPVRVNQILTNLLGNAIKFTDKGYIKFGYTISGSRLNFFVQDTGSGIPDTHLKTIFKRFRQVDQSDTRKHGGTGLGLAITKALLELMNGEISVESKVGEGTTFSFSLPLKICMFEKKTETHKEQAPDLTNKNIVIVEDDQNSAFLLQTMLANTHANIITFHTGQEAVNYCEDHPEIDFVFMDIQLPDISGHQGTKLIKEANDSIVVIAQTAQAMTKNKEEALRSGFDDFIPKPIQVEDVYNALFKFSE